MKKPLIISDFDGTITRQDVNDTIFMSYGDNETYEIEEKFNRGEIGVNESLMFHYKRLKISKTEFMNFVSDNIEIDPHFHDFYKYIVNREGDFAVVSGGFINYIEYIFRINNIEIESPIYANKLTFQSNGDININFLHDKEDLMDCHQDFGICGNCKHKIIENYKKSNYPIIYIGDGLTDRCAVEQSDYILVKEGSSLLNYCQEKALAHKTFVDFKDVKQIVKNYLI